MQRSLSLRIVSLVALLGVIGLFASGCTTVTLGTSGLLTTLFGGFVDAIGRENAHELAHEYFYSSVQVPGVYEYVDRSYIETEWQDHFDRYYISESRFVGGTGLDNDGPIARVRFVRIERRCDGDSPSDPMDTKVLTEEYALIKENGRWWITAVLEPSPR